ncbi:MAG: exosortase-associated EpsI family protein [Tepidisphaeraceae bacterium]
MSVIAPQPQPAPISSEIVATLRRPAFVVVLLVLLVAAVALNALIFSGKLIFKKWPVDLQKDVQLLPARLGPWVQVTEDEPLNEEQQHTLGTKQYLMRVYANRDLLKDPTMLDGLDKLSARDRYGVYGKVMRENPRAAIYVHMAYYTDSADTVAHVPERCMVGGGFDPENPTRQTLKLGNGLPPVDVKYIDFHPRESERDTNRSPTSNVAYFFQVNGEYAWDSIGQVRMKLQDLREKYGYYCKIEMSTQGLASEDARATMASFLTSALPEMEAILPDWEAVHGRPSKHAKPETAPPAAAKK